jgi:hypothetical protein
MQILSKASAISRAILRRLPHLTLLVLLGWLSFPLALPLIQPHESSHRLHAQNVYTDLSDPAQIRVFTEVSDGLICQCGCHFVLSSCPHVECPWGIPVRRFLEIKIREGMSAPEILTKMETGFGPEIRRYALVREFLEQGREDIVIGLESGWGPSISAHASAVPLVALILLTGTLAVFLFSYWWKGNRARNRAARNAPPEDKTPGGARTGTDERADRWESRVRDLDR